MQVKEELYISTEMKKMGNPKFSELENRIINLLKEDNLRKGENK